MSEAIKWAKEDQDFFEKAFEGMRVPQDIRTVAERICMSYGIRGECDPGYIANVVAKELGLGDGRSVFYNQVVST